MSAKCQQQTSLSAIESNVICDRSRNDDKGIAAAEVQNNFGARENLGWLKWLIRRGYLCGNFCQSRPEHRHFQQNRAIGRSVHMARQFYALSGEVPIRITPFHWYSSPKSPARTRSFGLMVPFLLLTNELMSRSRWRLLDIPRVFQDCGGQVRK